MASSNPTIYMTYNENSMIQVCINNKQEVKGPVIPYNHRQEQVM